MREDSSQEPLRKLDEYLAYLSRDGKWHSLDDISENISVNKEKLKIVTKFFAEFNLIDFKKDENKVMINPDFRKIYLGP